MADLLKRRDLAVGLGEGVLHTLSLSSTQILRNEQYHGEIPLEVDENYARSKVEQRPLLLVIIDYYSSLKILLCYLISLSSLITIGLSVGMTLYWYERMQNDKSIDPPGLDWVLLSFVLITPLSVTICLVFRRREDALIEIAKFRPLAYQLFLSHCIWDWGVPPKGKAAVDIDWVEHANDVLRELIAIGDELCRFLTLPTMSRCRHRMTTSGRREAARTAAVAYKLYDSLYSRRFVRLARLSERLKLAGLGPGETSRMRQYEQKMGECIERLRMIKMYRTSQTLRTFSRIFTIILPPFFAPMYAKLAVKEQSLAVGIFCAVITALCLHALFEGTEILEDPFVAFVTLDGIDVREEFQVLHWQQLVSARDAIFPNEKPFVDESSFFRGNIMTDDLESPALPSLGFSTGPPSGGGSDANHKMRRHRQSGSGLSMGDGIFLGCLKDDIKSFRESGFQLVGLTKRNGNTIPASALSDATPSVVVAVDHKEGKP